MQLAATMRHRLQLWFMAIKSHALDELAMRPCPGFLAVLLFLPFPK
jgi:hypothetical protein